MNDQQSLFVDYYCGQSRGNAADAAQRAGYANPKQDGWRLKQIAAVRAAIDERLAAHTLTSSEILARWTEVADANLEDFYVVEPSDYGDRDRLELDLIGAHRLGKFHLIKQIKETKYGTQIILHDPMAAKDRLARAQGVLTDLPARREEALVNAILDALPDDLRDTVEQQLAAHLSGQNT